MRADIPTPPDLPEWFSSFFSEYVNTRYNAYGHVSATAEGWKAYVALGSTQEFFDGVFPSAAEAMAAIVDYVARQAVKR